MKGLYLLFLVALAPSVHAQDFCKKVKKEVSEDKTQVEYTSPAPAHLAPITVKRVINTNPEWAIDNFTVIFEMASPIESIYTQAPDGSQKEKAESKLVVEFDDHTKFVDDTVVITHDFTDDRTMAIRNIFYPVTEASVNYFTTKKIVKFSLAGNERIIPADSANAIMHYFQCIKEGK
jgi:hypothetical protein